MKSLVFKAENIARNFVRIIKENIPFLKKMEKIRHGRNGFEKKYLAYDSFPEITDDELKQIRKTWPMWKIKKDDLIWSRVYKKFHGFSPYIIGNWHTYLLRQEFNPYEQLSSFEYKGLFDVYFPEIPFPKSFVRRIQNVYYDLNMQVISRERAVDILLQYDTYIIKPSFGTNQGKGVEKVNLNVVDKKKRILESFEDQKSDFIAQEVLEQHPDVAALNPTSLNCCRVTSVYIDGKFGFSTVFKIGKAGSNIDNWRSSYFCGVCQDGTLSQYGFANDLKIVEQTDNGITIRGFRLPCYKDIVILVEKYHKKYFPNCGMIGWDVLVDKNNSVRVIEMNLTVPGLVAEQLAAGDFLKDFRDEIVKRLTK